MKILFVEDTDVFINRYKPMLETLGEVHHYKSSNGARKAIGNEEEGFDFDLIVCDHNILRFEEELKPALGNEIYYHIRMWCSETVPFIHFSAAPCPEEYDIRMLDHSTDKNFHILGKNYDSPLLDLIEEIIKPKEE